MSNEKKVSNVKQKIKDGFVQKFTDLMMSNIKGGHFEKGANFDVLMAGIKFPDEIRNQPMVEEGLYKSLKEQVFNEGGKSFINLINKLMNDGEELEKIRSRIERRVSNSVTMITMPYHINNLHIAFNGVLNTEAHYGDFGRVDLAKKRLRSKISDISEIDVKWADYIEANHPMLLRGDEESISDITSALITSQEKDSTSPEQKLAALEVSYYETYNAFIQSGFFDGVVFRNTNSAEGPGYKLTDNKTGKQRLTLDEFKTEAQKHLSEAKTKLAEVQKNPDVLKGKADALTDKKYVTKRITEAEELATDMMSKKKSRLKGKATAKLDTRSIEFIGSIIGDKTIKTPEDKAEIIKAFVSKQDPNNNKNIAFFAARRGEFELLDKIAEFCPEVLTQELTGVVDSGKAAEKPISPLNELYNKHNKKMGDEVSKIITKAFKLEEHGFPLDSLEEMAADAREYIELLNSTIKEMSGNKEMREMSGNKEIRRGKLLSSIKDEIAKLDTQINLSEKTSMFNAKLAVIDSIRDGSPPDRIKRKLDAYVKIESRQQERANKGEDKNRGAEQDKASGRDPLSGLSGPEKDIVKQAKADVTKSRKERQAKESNQVIPVQPLSEKKKNNVKISGRT